MIFGLIANLFKFIFNFSSEQSHAQQHAKSKEKAKAKARAIAVELFKRRRRLAYIILNMMDMNIAMQKTASLAPGQYNISNPSMTKNVTIGKSQAKEDGEWQSRAESAKDRIRGRKRRAKARGRDFFG